MSGTTLKMAAWAEGAGLSMPEILEIPGVVLVRFRRKMPKKTTWKTSLAVLQLLREEPNLPVPRLSERLAKSELTPAAWNHAESS